MSAPTKPPGRAEASGKRPPSWARKALDALVAFARRQAREAAKSPVTLSIVGILWVVGVLTRSVVDGPPEDLLMRFGMGGSSLADGHLWAPVTAAFFAGDLAIYIGVTILLLIVGSICERRWGSLRMLWMSLLIQVVGMLLGVGLVALADAVFDWNWADYLSSSEPEVGASPLIAGLLLAFSGGLSALWRRRIRVGVLTVCLVAMLYGGQLQDVLRMSTALVGMAVGAVFLHVGSRHVTSPSRRETRVLVAVVIAATALGPILVAVTGEIEGPLSALADLYVGPKAYSTEDRDLAEILMALVPALLVLVLAAGLRRGRRFAWWATMLFHVVLLAVGTLLRGRLLRVGGRERPAGRGFQLDRLAAAARAAAARRSSSCCLLTRRSFTVLAPAGVYRRLGLVVLGVLVGLWAIFVLLGALLASQFTPDADGRGARRRISRCACCPTATCTSSSRASSRPPCWRERWWTGCRWSSGRVILFGLLRSFVAARVESDAEDRRRAREILERDGTTALAYLTTWEGNSYWFSADGQSFVAYRVEGGVAITTGDPVGPPEDARATTVEEFVAFCNVRELDALPVQHDRGRQARSPTGSAGRACRWRRRPCCRWASWPSPARSSRTSGSSISRAGKGGIVAEWMYYPDAPLAIRDQIQAISEEWVSDKALPEMGFTLGGLDELDDPAVRCLIAVDHDRTIHGITSWMPCYRDGVPVGWTLDFMRRRGEGFKGVMEFLIGTAALDLQKEGAEFVSLSGAPLAQANPGRGAGGRAEAARDRRQDDGTGVRVPVAAEVQGQVPAGVPADVHVLPGGRRCCRGSASASRTPTCRNMTFGQAVRMMGQLT